MSEHDNDDDDDDDDDMKVNTEGRQLQTNASVTNDLSLSPQQCSLVVTFA